ncbi:peptide deformylase [Bacteroidia bacterium]|nr:peptide deformylase [Bacteroidia bacterium]
MTLPIYLYGHPVLRKEMQEITPDYPDFRQLLENMYETMANADGVGIAAPQVGLAERFFVIDLTAIENDPLCKDFKKAFINPKLIETGGEATVAEEGCLSVPDIHEKVPRPSRIRLQYLDENFQPHDEIFEGFPARAIQHEYDHLEGIVFVDRIAGIRKQMIRSKLNKIMDGKAHCTYKTKRKQ